MTKARMDGAILVFLGACLPLMLVVNLVIRPSAAAYKDFKGEYLAARSLLAGSDPYNPAVIARMDREAGVEQATDTALDHVIVSHYFYPPSIFVVTAPFALLPWKVARVLWLLLSAGGLMLAALLAYDLGADYAPLVSGALVGLVLVNTEVLLVLCNPSALDIALSVIAVWCFLRRRFVPLGVLCMALSLALKPQDAGFIWLYFLVAGSLYRRRALQSLLATVALSLAPFVAVFRLAPRWPAELRANLLALSVRGGLNDPGPVSAAQHQIIDLQSALSYLRDEPRFYNLWSLLIFAVLLALWIVITLRARPTAGNAVLALAAIAPLSMLPVMHHLYDCKLLLLTIPSCAWLWSHHRSLGRVALLLSAPAIFFSGDIGNSVWSRILRTSPLASGASGGFHVDFVLAWTVPTLLLATGLFYLWVDARNANTSGLPDSEAHPLASMESSPPR
ncbi:MAG TPA: glycosyltransferase family 87 protein [Terracidiphilus sp.]|nr:glycosyltransferase family 87 protein [Terracidiphilus sp.]